MQYPGIVPGSAGRMQQELLNTVFDRQLYYKEGIYRTTYIMEMSTHNALKLGQQQLLYIEKSGTFLEKSRQVELPGVEPGSKHIRHKLSTCLFSYCLSGYSRNLTNQPYP